MAFVLGPAGILLVAFGAYFSAQAWVCTRGEQCLGPFVAYFFLGVPAFLGGFLALCGALAAAFGAASWRRPIAAAALTWLVAVGGLTTALWTK